ncbi:hypothetical protein [Streptomyces sp. NPDC057582]|uniref:hypothetical protein n=1 Tax=Streptomyces sp. NPDC057582 TaxID=3346174 RepID=UPI0036A4B074
MTTAPPPAGELAEDGRGLLPLAAATDRWGVEELPGGAGKTVWFECDRADG